MPSVTPLCQDCSNNFSLCPHTRISLHCLLRSRLVCHYFDTQTNMKLAAQILPKCNTSLLVEHVNVWNVCRAFVTSTRPLQKKVDKETAEKVKEAAEAVTDGIKEARQTGKFVKETVSANAGTVISEMAKKAVEKASESDDEDGNGKKSPWQKVKDAVNGKDKGK